MSIIKALPNYEQLFGDLDFKKTDDSRTVYSPAAYLADLLKLLDDNFNESDFESRRDDIKNILLNSENSFNLTSYLDIVNRILEQKIIANSEAEDAYSVLANASYPFNMPFDLSHERAKLYLSFMETKPQDLLQLFVTENDEKKRQETARLILGLSVKAYDDVVAPKDQSQTAACFNLSDDKLIFPFSVKDFLHDTGLTGVELRALLFQQLSETSEDRSVAKIFYINQGFDGYASLDSNEDSIIWIGNTHESFQPWQWFERVNRFVRLSQHTGLSFVDLECVLRTCCNNQLGHDELGALAIAMHLNKTNDLPIDVISCLLSGKINTIGQGAETEPQDLFNRIYNGRFVAIQKKYFKADKLASLPKEYGSYDPFSTSYDLLAAEQKDLRQRIQQALQIGSNDLTLIISTFRNHALSNSKTSILSGGASYEALSLLFRLSKLMEVLDVTAQELIDVLGLLSTDPSLRKSKQFPISIEELTSDGLPNQNGFDILEANSISDSQWLLQTVFALFQWMKEFDFSSDKLRQILNGKFRDDKEKTNWNEQQITFLQNIYNQFASLAFSKGNLVADNVDSRIARVLYSAFTSASQLGITTQNTKVLKVDADTVYHSTYEALSQTVLIRPDDFAGIGLSDGMLTKIYNNLILKNYLQADGALNENQFPLAAESFKPVTDFTAQRNTLFNIVQQLYLEQLDETTDDTSINSTENEFDEAQISASSNDAAEVSISIFPSDLESLNISQEAKTELYDNLIFNGYIEETGDVIQPDFFATDEHKDSFNLNVNLSTFAIDIYNAIKDRTSRFLMEPFQLNEEIFESLNLTDRDLTQLIENLQFNGYIDADKVFTDKAALLNTTVADFNIALVFYPNRIKIFNTLQNAIAEFKSKFYSFKTDDFAEVVDRAVAQNIYDALTPDYFPEGKPNSNCISYFVNDENKKLFNVSLHYLSSSNEVLFDALKSIVNSVQQFRISIAAMTELDLNADEQDILTEALQNAGWLNQSQLMPEMHLPYFLNINNALLFNLDGYADFNKDIFFLLNAVAVKMDSRINNTIEQLTNLADRQNQLVLDALAEALGLDASVVKVVAHEILGGESHLPSEIILPVLAVVDSLDRVLKVPESNKFNIAYRRMYQFALLAKKLGLNKSESEVVFYDQALADKFPEPFALPAGINSFDALLELKNEAVLVNGLLYNHLIYLFKGNQYWAYDALTYNLIITPSPLSNFAAVLANVNQVDAAFTDPINTAWLISGANYFSRESGKKEWQKQDKKWGMVQNNFDHPERIDASFLDNEGKTYLFSNNQYIRYSKGYEVVDEGYPKNIKENWKKELYNVELPESFLSTIDASFQSPDGTTYFFKDNSFISSGDFAKQISIQTAWGKVANNFTNLNRIDAACTYGGMTFLFSGNQVITYADSIENNGVKAEDGNPLLLEKFMPGLPDIFEDGIDAVFANDETGESLHIFKDDQYLNVKKESTTILTETKNTREIWGTLKNNLAETGIVDAAFVGLDGKTYLFSGTQYYCYSGSNYTEVDEGFPRTIATDWGGLSWVDAAFILDGKTFVFGTNQNEESVYVQYSTRNYSTPDENFPMPTGDNWWNLPNQLIVNNFDRPDAVLVGQDGKTYLFKDTQFIYYNHLEGWWSDPLSLKENWDSIPFYMVTAAFTGKDSKTYIFTSDEGGSSFVRYSDQQYNKIDDRFPKPTQQHWGKVVNNIAKTGKVDAALTITAAVAGNGENVPNTINYTYLFSGNQFYRYTNADFANTDNAVSFADEGYPRYIKSSLKSEPRFQNLNVALDSGIDAAFADQRNIYLFKDKQWHVIADVLYKEYPVKDSTVKSVLTDGGKLFIGEENNWSKWNSIESSKTKINTQVLPLVLRNVPDGFKQNLNAVLNGANGNTYLFKDQQCYNTGLNRAYPINEEWGRYKNNIYLNNRVDAGFVGLDGKTYLFSGDQFVTYLPYENSNALFPGLTDGNPKSIAANWGGLLEIKLAFVKGNKTYIFEKADRNGNMRYNSYSTTDYNKPDTDTPLVTDAILSNINETWAQIPGIYVEDGFNTVDAVLFEEDNVFLINGNSYIQFNEKQAHWSYSKPLEHAWRDMPYNKTDFEKVVTAFTGADGKTYFFSEEVFAVYQSGMILPTNGATLQTIRNIWGISNNNFVLNNRIDAAFVDGNGFTYLFSKEQYVRYSKSDYRFIDEGYPLNIAESLRSEPSFVNLPESFDEEIQQLFDEGKSIGGVITDKRNIFLFYNQKCVVVSNSLTASYNLDVLGKVRNNIQENNGVDAAFVDAAGKTYLFSGDQYYRYSSVEYEFADQGYPLSIAGNLATELNLSDFPAAMENGIDTVFNGTDGKLYFFKDKSFYTPGSAEKAVEDKWGKVNNVFAESQNLDAVFIAADSKLYAFKGEQFIRYSSADNLFVDEGFPKAIKDNWGNLPVSFESGIDGAYFYEGRTYLIKEDSYVRYSNAAYKAIDAIYPQKFINRFGSWADFLLGDLRAISRYKKLQDEFGGGDYSLTDLLHPAITQSKPYQALATMFGWEIDEIKWLKRNQVFLHSDKLFEVNFDLEAILKMQEIFAFAAKLGHPPSVIYDAVWLNWFGDKNSTANAANSLYRFLGEMNSEKDWIELSKKIHNAENVLKRDALLPYVISITEGVNNARHLYELLLIDAEMGSCGNTSVILEATAAIQLYFYRYFMNLEDLDLSVEDDKQVALRAELKKWWAWMKNYRTWEANRKVFLYPENYIRPELRDTKTPPFKTLEDDLLQNEVTDAAIESVYRKYLDDYTEVSRLTIAGGYVYNDPAVIEDKQLILFGRTKSAPPRYYYRTARFVKGLTNAAQWGAWLPFNNLLEAQHVYPVYAFGKIFVFWAKAERSVDSSKSVINFGASSVNTDTHKRNEVKIYFSYYGLNKDWTTPQLLDTDIVSTDVDISEFDLYVEKADLMDEENYENILITCSYKAGGKSFASAYYLTPELYTNPALKPDFSNKAQTVFQSIFGYEEQMSSKRAVQLSSNENSTEGPWFSFDHKGGSFLAKPTQLGYVTKFEDLQTTIPSPPKAIDYTLSLQSNIYEKGKISCAFIGIDKTFLFCDDECLIFTNGKYSYADAGSPYKITAANSLEKLLPATNNPFTEFTKKEWKNFDAGVIAPNGVPIFFKGTEFLIGENIYDIKSIWTKEETAKPDPKTAKSKKGSEEDTVTDSDTISIDDLNKLFLENKKIDAAFIFNDKLYITIGNYYVRTTFYEEGYGLNFIETGYPKQLSNNTEKLPQWQKIDAAFNSGKNKMYFFNDSIYCTSDKIAEKLDIKVWGRIGSNLSQEKFDVAYSKDNKLFRFVGAKYYRYSIDANQIAQLDKNPNPNPGSDPYSFDLKLPQLNNVKLAFVKHDATNQAGKLYLVTSDSYIRCDTANYDKKDDGYPKSGSLGNLLMNEFGFTYNPAFFQTLNWGYLDSSNWLYVQLNNQLFQIHLDLKIIIPIFPYFFFWNWDNRFQFFDFYYKSQFLHNADAFVAFTGKKEADKNLTSVKLGFYNTFFKENDNPTLKIVNEVWGFSKIDAAFVLNNVTYLFSKDKYYRLKDNTEPNDLPEMQSIKGNWGNIPASFLKGIDNGWIGSDNFLYLVKGNQFVSYNLSLGEDNLYNHPVPYEIDRVKYDIIRLTTSTGKTLNERLLSGGIANLLSLETQNIDEVPAFSASISNASTIRVNDTKVNTITLPLAEYLDFSCANGPYYWEIFFHLPFLIAQYFNANQKFDLAKTWYEYIYDPTEFNKAGNNEKPYWKFLPFHKDNNKPYEAAAEEGVYFNDPFDPHAIAALRTEAYQKTIVMSYIDNLLDWGDMLFRQYTMESLNEARMLYVLAYDLLGDKPENVGAQVLSEAKSYEAIKADRINADIADELLQIENAMVAADAVSVHTESANTINDTVVSNYFIIPENEQFIDYWNRVEDRLYKIRHCLNIMGIEQSLPLFEPPVDPMAMVQAASGGGGFEQVIAGSTYAVPHYRFNFMLDKAQQLVQKLNELSGELLSALEKKDGEALSMMQSRHEGIILNLTRDIKRASIEEAKYSINGLKESLHNANLRKDRYNKWIDGGLSNYEQAQLGLIITATALQSVGFGLKLASAIGYLFPTFGLGPFIIGAQTPKPGDSIGKFAESADGLAQALSFANEAVGIAAQNYRSSQDWELQRDMAASDIIQITAQIAGAEQQLIIAKRDAEIHEKQIAQNIEVAGFYKDKFTSQQLYLWMAGKLSGLFFQYYKLAFDMSKYAERAYQFERGVKESEVNFIQPAYWDSQHKGLLVGLNLGYDLDRMQKAFIETDTHRFEITKQVSLLELDPMALLKLKSKGSCEFSLTEALFDYDFQGHYNRQIKTITISFAGLDGAEINATLTQLSHKTILEPDAKAVKYLLNPKDQPPVSIRSDWRANQQIALSYTDAANVYEKNNGMFELRFDSERYLPFEGTGAVSDWLLELNGKRGAYDLSKLTNVTVQLKYTALQGGKAFGQAVKSLLKPYATGVMINIAETFADKWTEFQQNDSKSLELTFTREQFPNMSGSKIQGIFSKFDLTAAGPISMVINGNADMTLKDGKYIDTSGLTIAAKGTALTFVVKGNKAILTNFYLVMAYKAMV